MTLGLNLRASGAHDPKFTEIIKAQFSNISWRSVYGIAGTAIATAIAGVLFAVGKKCCFKKVRSMLEKHVKQ